MAAEWGHLNIRVNAIAPGVVLTESSSSMTSQSRRQIETVPLLRLGAIDDVGPLAVYFAADESNWTSGTVVQVTGDSRIPVGALTYLHKRRQEAFARAGDTAPLPLSGSASAHPTQLPTSCAARS